MLCEVKYAEEDPDLRQWSGDQGSPLTPVKNLALSFASHGNMVATSERAWGNGIVLREVWTLGRRGQCGKGVRIASVFFSYDNRIVGGLNKEEQSIYLWDALSLQTIGKIPIGKLGSGKGDVNWTVYKSEIGDDRSRKVFFELSPTFNLGRTTISEQIPPHCLWEAMRDSNASNAYNAMSCIVEQANRLLPYLRRQLKPVPKDEPDWVQALFANLDSGSFEDRERASKELREEYQSVIPYILRRLQGRGPLELHKRLTSVMHENRNKPPSRERLRELRAIEVLEYIGTREAQELLRHLSQGAPEAQLTKEATAALERL
jgi:hypothetical protein